MKGKGLRIASGRGEKEKNSKAEVWRQRSGDNQFSMDLAAASTGSGALVTIPRAAVSLRHGSDRMVKFCAENQKGRRSVHLDGRVPSNIYFKCVYRNRKVP